MLTGESVAEDPLQAVERRDLLSLGALAMRKRLSPTERAALVLHEAIGLTHAEIGAVLGAHRGWIAPAARPGAPGVTADPARQPSPRPEMHRRLVASLRAPFDTGDTASLVGLPRQGPVLLVDTGGELPAPHRPIVGSAEVSLGISML